MTLIPGETTLSLTDMAQVTGYNTQSTSMINMGLVKCQHVMGDETEVENGSMAGFCVTCGDKSTGRRIIGGMGLAKLKNAIVDALGDPEAMAGLLEEIDRVELMLKVEEQSLRSAYDMIEMARKMVKTIVLPKAVDDDDGDSVGD